MKICSICLNKADIYTSVHKKDPFVDGRNYETVCFTCFYVPKTMDQTYGPDGSVKEEMHLPYSCENLCSPSELQRDGPAENSRQAKASVEAVTKLCCKAKGGKIPKKRPSPSWNMS